MTELITNNSYLREGLLICYQNKQYHHFSECALIHNNFRY